MNERLGAPRVEQVATPTTRSAGRPLHEYPYWWDTISAVRSARPKAEVAGRKYDVAIVGAGYTGLAAARHLARVGASVAVLERDHVGAGASSRNGGQVLTGLRLDPATLVKRYGEQRARELFDASIESIRRLEALVAEEAIECDYQQTGHVQAAAKPSHFEAFRDEQALLGRVFNHAVTLVSRQDQESELGTRRYHGLLVDDRSAGLNPARYVQGLHDAAARAGATVATGCAVTAIRRHAGRWSVSAEDLSIEADAVLLATDAYTLSLLPALQRRIVPVGSYVLATEPLDETVCARVLPRRRMAFDSKNFLLYFRLTPDRRLLFGGRAEFSPPTERSLRRAAITLRRAMVGLFPELERTRVEYAWGGSVAFTRDELPHAGQLDGAFFAAGYCGHGIAMATWLGELISRRIAGEIISHPLLDAPFPPIPLYRGYPWFLPFAGTYYKVKDWVH
jgi:glycine/D-amino acid oxidase-like deaminating enzyme